MQASVLNLRVLSIAGDGARTRNSDQACCAEASCTRLPAWGAIYIDVMSGSFHEHYAPSITNGQVSVSRAAVVFSIWTARFDALPGKTRRLVEVGMFLTDSFVVQHWSSGVAEFADRNPPKLDALYIWEALSDAEYTDFLKAHSQEISYGSVAIFTPRSIGSVAPFANLISQ